MSSMESEINILNKEIQVTDKRMKPLVIGNETFRSADDFRLTKIDLHKAWAELNETEERKGKCLKELKAKLAKENRLNWRMDDDFLLRFIRHGKFSCDKAYNKIRNLYTLRKNYPEVFNLTPKLQYLLNSELIIYMPYRDDDGIAVAWIKFGKWNVDDISIFEFLQLVTAVWDILSMNPSTQIHGLYAVWDFRGFSFRHATQILHPSNLRFVMNIIQDAYPWRVKGLYLLHCNYLIRNTYAMMRPLIKKKIADRIKFLGSDMSELHQYVNPMILPKEYGGSLEDSEIVNVKQHILNNFPYLQYERSFGYV